MEERIVSENRQYTRVKRVRPVNFHSSDLGQETAQRTVTANVSRGGMLLVTREDNFPLQGTMVEVYPQAPQGNPQSSSSIAGQIVYTRFSPKTDLYFAGLQFVDSLSEKSAYLLGLDSGKEQVVHAFRAIEDIDGDYGAKVEEEAAPRAEDVADIELESLRLRTALEEGSKDFMAMARIYLKDWVEEIFAQTIENRHGLAHAKGVIGLRAMKDDLELLLEDVPMMVEAELNRDELWPHRGEQMDDVAAGLGLRFYYDPDDGRPSLRVTDSLRRLLGFAGVVLVKHGFVELARNGDWSLSARSSGQVCYRGAVMFSELFLETSRQVSALFEELCVNDKRLTQAREMYAKQEARVLWEKA